MNKLSKWMSQFGKDSQIVTNSPKIRIVILAVAAACLAYGCMRGELQVVLGKAVIVCLECIGLG